MSSTNKIIIAVLVLLAVALGGFGYWTANRVLSGRGEAQVGRSQPSDQPKAVFPVVVATATLAAGKPISKESVKLLDYPQVPEGGYDDISKVVGLVPQTTIGPGVPVLNTYLVSGLSTHVQSGFRAVAVRIDQVIGVGDHLRPGDLVDVFFTLPAAQAVVTGAGNAPLQTRMLLSGVRVLAVGPASVAKAGAAAKPADGQTGAGQPQSPYQAPATPATSAVLQVSTADVPKLAMSADSGKLLLALRNPHDAGQPDTTAFPVASPAVQPALASAGKRKEVMSNPDSNAYAGLTLSGLRNPDAPAAGAATSSGKPRATVEIYRGDHKQVVSY